MSFTKAKLPGINLVKMVQETHKTRIDWPEIRDFKWIAFVFETWYNLWDLKSRGENPYSKDLLIRKEIGSEIPWLRSFKIITVNAVGPVDFEAEKIPMTLKISSGVVGVWVWIFHKSWKMVMGRGQFGSNGRNWLQFQD